MPSLRHEKGSYCDSQRQPAADRSIVFCSQCAVAALVRTRLLDEIFRQACINVACHAYARRFGSVRNAGHCNASGHGPYWVDPIGCPYATHLKAVTATLDIKEGHIEDSQTQKIVFADIRGSSLNRGLACCRKQDRGRGVDWQCRDDEWGHPLDRDVNDRNTSALRHSPLSTETRCRPSRRTGRSSLLFGLRCFSGGRRSWCRVLNIRR